MQKLFAILFLLCCSVGLSVLVLTKGWGLSPHSWGWIIGAGIIGQSIIQVMSTKLIAEK